MNVNEFYLEKIEFENIWDVELETSNINKKVFENILGSQRYWVTEKARDQGQISSDTSTDFMTMLILDLYTGQR